MIAWGKVLLIFILGPFGVHKFLEGNTKMGFIYLFTFGLLGFGWMFDVIKAVIDAVKGVDSSFGGNNYKTNVILQNGENCLYFSDASYAITKNVLLGYSGGGGGVSIRVSKGLSFHTGASAKNAIRGDVVNKYPGFLTITNKRIVFAGTKGSFDKPITSLTAITPFKDAVSFQFGNTTYPLIVKNTKPVTRAVNNAINYAQQENLVSDNEDV